MATTCTWRWSFTSAPSGVRALTVKVNGVISPCIPAYGLGGRIVALAETGTSGVIWYDETPRLFTNETPGIVVGGFEVMVVMSAAESDPLVPNVDPTSAVNFS